MTSLIALTILIFAAAFGIALRAEQTQRIIHSHGWQAFATRESKGAIVTWLAVGAVHQWWVGALLSLPTVLLFMPGIFIASLAQIPVAILNALKIVRLSEMRSGTRPRNPAELLGWTVWWGASVLYIPLLAIGFVRLIASVVTFARS